MDAPRRAREIVPNFESPPNPANYEADDSNNPIR
jgi:hypothetical protein